LKSANPNRKARRQAQNSNNSVSIGLDFQALNRKQEEFVEAYENGSNIFAYGSAGTGKSFLSLYLALNEILNSKGKIGPKKILIVRSTVAVRDQGFLPGTVEEKEAPFIAPYRKMVNEICDSGTAYDELSKKGIIQFTSTSFLRGLTLDDTIIILDEVQNCGWEEISTTLTRVGLESRVIVCGDGKQDDLRYKKFDTSGFQNLLKVVERMGDSFTTVTFSRDEIIRSGFVKSFIIACEDVGL